MSYLTFFAFLLSSTRINTETFRTIDIPEINLKEFIDGSNQQKIQISGIFKNAFHDIGAVRFINHAIEMNLFNDVFKSMKIVCGETDT